MIKSGMTGTSGQMRFSSARSTKLLGKPDEKPFRPADVAEPISVAVLNDFPDELRATFAQPGNRLVQVVDGEHDAKVAQGVHRGVAMVRDDRRRKEAGKFKPAVAVWRAHHGNLDVLITQPRHSSGPFTFDHGPPFQIEAKLAKEIDCAFEVLDDDSDVVHPYECQVPNLQNGV